MHCTSIHCAAGHYKSMLIIFRIYYTEITSLHCIQLWFWTTAYIFAWGSYSYDEFTLHSYQFSTSLRFCSIIVSYWHLISSRIFFRSGPGQELTSTLTSPVDWFLRQLISCKDNPDQLVQKEEKVSRVLWQVRAPSPCQWASTSWGHFGLSQHLSVMHLLHYTPKSDWETTDDFQAKRSWAKEKVGVFWGVWWLITAN